MKRKYVLLFFVIIMLIVFLYFDITQYLSLEYMKSQQTQLQDFYKTNPVSCISLFCGLYILMTALCVPGATLLTILGGATFGLWTGVILTSFSSAIGATGAFLGSRWLLRDYVSRRFSKYVGGFNRGVEKNGAFYLFLLRLTPLFPFTATNLVMGITSMRTWTFYFFTQLGMLAGTMVYTNAGTELGSVHGLRDIISAKVFLSFVALGVLPLFLKHFSILRDGEGDKKL